MSEKVTIGRLAEKLRNRPRYGKLIQKESYIMAMQKYEESFKDFEGDIAQLQKQLREIAKSPVSKNQKLMSWVILNLTAKKGRFVRAEAIRKFVEKQVLGEEVKA